VCVSLGWFVLQAGGDGDLADFCTFGEIFTKKMGDLVDLIADEALETSVLSGASIIIFGDDIFHGVVGCDELLLIILS